MGQRIPSTEWRTYPIWCAVYRNYRSSRLLRGRSQARPPIWWMARMMAENPARIFGLYPRKGVIQPGSDADLLIVDPHAESTIQAINHQSTTGYTPYEGWKVSGKPWMTMLRGKILLKDGQLEQSPGSGMFIPADGPLPPIAGRVD